MYFLEELKHIPIGHKQGLESMMIKSSLRSIYNHLDNKQKQQELFIDFQNFIQKMNNFKTKGEPAG